MLAWNRSPTKLGVSIPGQHPVPEKHCGRGKNYYRLSAVVFLVRKGPFGIPQFHAERMSHEWTPIAEKKRAYTTTTESFFLENFSGLKEKLSRPVIDTETLFKNQENHIYHWNLSSVAPIFSAKKSSPLKQGGVCFLFSQNRMIPIAAQRTQGVWGPISAFWGELWLPTNASDSNRGESSR